MTLRILHVEDDPVYRATLRAALQSIQGLTLEQVDTLAAARARLSDLTAPSFDALLVDLRLPDARDLEAIIALRPYRIPLVVLSALSLPETLERAAEAGACDYLIKGQFDSTQLARRVRFACRRYAKHMEAVACEASTRPPFKRRGIEPGTFEALKPFITCAIRG